MYLFFLKYFFFFFSFILFFYWINRSKFIFVRILNVLAAIFASYFHLSRCYLVSILIPLYQIIHEITNLSFLLYSFLLFIKNKKENKLFTPSKYMMKSVSTFKRFRGKGSNFREENFL